MLNPTVTEEDVIEYYQGYQGWGETSNIWMIFLGYPKFQQTVIVNPPVDRKETLFENEGD